MRPFEAGIDRRRLLQLLGLGGAGLAVAPAARPDDEPPKRLIVVSGTHGSVRDSCVTNPAGLPDDVAWEQPLAGLAEDELGAAYTPLHPHRERLLLLDGVSMLTAELDSAGDRHAKGWLHAWTGAWSEFRAAGNALSATAPSLDQLVARAIARPDRLPSLELSVGAGRPVCHAGPGQQLPLIDDPNALFTRLFRVGRSGDPLVDARSSVLDLVLADHAAHAARLDAAGRARLEAHFDLVRQLELRLAGLAAAGCEGAEPIGAADHRAAFEAHAELVTAALACDLTRVVTLSVGDVPADAFGYGGAGSGDVHNDFAHAVFDSPFAAEVMTAYQRFQAEELALLIRTLEAVPEGDGTLMDHTLIVWGNEIADGWHGYHRYLPVLVGGGWALRTGRAVHWPDDVVPVPLSVPGGLSAGAGIPHQRVLVTVARAMGLDVDHVGLETVDVRGVQVDLRGALEEL